MRRPWSPPSGLSTLTTSAPSQARSCVHDGPASNCVRSRMRMPESAAMEDLLTHLRLTVKQQTPLEETIRKRQQGAGSEEDRRAGRRVGPSFSAARLSSGGPGRVRPQSASTCSTVEATPFVVEKLGDMVSRCHGLPNPSRYPPHRSTTHAPCWYTHTAAPPEYWPTRLRSVRATGMKSGWTKPSTGKRPLLTGRPPPRAPPCPATS